MIQVERKMHMHKCGFVISETMIISFVHEGWKLEANTLISGAQKNEFLLC